MAETLHLFGPDGPSEEPTGGTGPHPSFIDVAATVFRCVDYDTPVWAGPNTRPGRWHHSGRRITAQYWSYSPSTAWAEVLRSQGIRDAADVLEMRMRMWAGQVRFTQVADLNDPAWTSWLGLTDDDLLDDDHAACRAAGLALIACGAGGVVAPSAAMPDHSNLVLFRRLIRGDWVESTSGPLDLRFPEKMLPCHLISYGRPSTDLVHRVRYRKAPGE